MTATTNTPAIVRAAKWALENGYTHMASVAKGYKATTYYHVVRCQQVIDENKWIPAKRRTNAKGATYREGVTWPNVPEKTVRRDDALASVRS